MAGSQQLLLGEGAGGAEKVYIEDVFSNWLYTGNGSTQTITNGIDLSTKGGMVWTKSRSNAFNNMIIDTARTSQYLLYTNTTGAQANQGATIADFNTNGYTFTASGNPWNTNNYTNNEYVGWSFRKQPKFFDMVTYTGTGSARTIAHNLGSTPGCIIVKNLTTASDWRVYHRGLTSAEYDIRLNLTNAQASVPSAWNSTAPTSTVFSLGANTDTNGSGDSFVAYLFAHDAGGFGLTGTDNVISCGSFTENGSTQNINLGYEPQWIMTKLVTGNEDWIVFDNMRGWSSYPGPCNDLNPNTSAAETTIDGFLTPTSTGFRTDPYAGSGNKYIYIAIRRGPMKVPTDATKVFKPVTRTRNATATTTTGVGFTPDFWMTKPRSADWSPIYDRLRGYKYQLYTHATNAEYDSSADSAFSGFDTMDGVRIGSDPSNWYTNNGAANQIDLYLKRAPSFFDEVCYTGTGANQNVSHNLTVAPELLITKNRTTGGINWFIYSSALGNNKILNFDTSASNTSSTTWNSTSPTSSVFTVGADTNANASGDKYVAYLFATCAGVSKVGSYTGTGTTKQVDCGFAAGARFVLVKATSTTGNWIVVDTARGLVSGNDPTLLLNSTAAEVTSTDWFDPYSAGFELSNASGNLANTNGTEYIYFAVA